MRQNVQIRKRHTWGKMSIFERGMQEAKSPDSKEACRRQNIQIRKRHASSHFEQSKEAKSQSKELNRKTLVFIQICQNINFICFPPFWQFPFGIGKSQCTCLSLNLEILVRKALRIERENFGVQQYWNLLYWAKLSHFCTNHAWFDFVLIFQYILIDILSKNHIKTYLWYYLSIIWFYSIFNK